MNASPLEQVQRAYQAGRFEQAYAMCAELLRRGLDNEHVRHFAAVSAAQLDRLDLAGDHAHVLINVTADANYQLNAARVLERAGRLDDARRANEAILSRHADHPDALANLANLARLASQPDDAIELYQRALTLREDATVLANFATLLSQLERLDEARVAIERAVALEPDAADLRAAAADVAAADGRYDDAVDAYRAALARAPDALDAHGNLATTLLRAQRLDEALSQASELDARDPGNRTAAAVRYLAALKTGDERTARAEMDTQLLDRSDAQAGDGFAQLELFTATLRDEVLAHPSLHYEPSGKTTRAGAQTANLVPDAGPALRALIQLIREHVDRYLTASNTLALKAARRMPQYELNVWATVLDEGGHQAPHIHPAGVVSGVYYVSVPDPAASAIEFGAAPDDFAPYAAAHTHRIEPAAGTLLLFPSQYYHRTLPGHSRGQRISIAFDAIPRGIDHGLPAETQHRLAQVRQALNQNRSDVAAALLREMQTHTDAPLPAQVRAVQGRVALAQLDAEGAARHLSAALEDMPRAVGWWRTLAAAEVRAGRYDLARAALERALLIDPDNEGAGMSLAATHTDLGDTDAAVAAYRRVIAARPSSGQAWYGLSLQASAAHVANEREALEDALAAPGLSSADRVGLHFALARACDAGAQYDDAFAHYAAGNAEKLRAQPFDAEAEERNGRAIEAAFTADVFDTFAEAGNAARTPIVIVGMPRSGSTLVEQIISAHPDVAAAGETNALWYSLNALPQRMPKGTQLPRDVLHVPADAWPTVAAAYLAQLEKDAGAAARITDKLPFNYTLLGMLRIMLPNATVIDTRRNAMDTCWSCFATSFGNERGFTTDLGHLGRTYRAYDRLMRHWHDVLPNGLHTVRYEALVADIEGEVRRLLDALALSWHDGCLAFFDNPRAVQTASYAQVRRPIYTSSIGRWRRYASHLAPLREALGPLADDDASAP